MTNRKTVQFNVRVEADNEPLARSVIDRIRRGGPGFRQALEAFLREEEQATYVPRMEFDARCRSLEAEIATLRDTVRGISQTNAHPVAPPLRSVG